MAYAPEKMRAYNRAYRAANRDRLNEKQRADRAANSEKFAARNRAWKKANPEKVRAGSKKYRENSKDRRAEALRAIWTKQNRLRPGRMLARQEIMLGRKKPAACEACGDTDRIVFDHCHERGHPRGWLCNRCNVALGCVEDDVSHLRKLIAYLERNRVNTAPQFVLPGI